MTALSPAATLVRRHDPDRFLCSLFAPPDRREALMLLYAFNHELARAREVTSEPTLALIRLQWWREVVEGVSRPHPFAPALGVALDAGRLARADLLAVIDGRELEAEPGMPELADFQDYVRATAGALAVAAGGALGATDAERDRLRGAGAAYGVAGQLRSVSSLASHGRCMLPADVLAEHGLSPDVVIARPDDPALRPVLGQLAVWGRSELDAARGRFRRQVMPAALPGVLAGRDFRRDDGPARPRGIADRLAVVAHAVISAL